MVKVKVPLICWSHLCLLQSAFQQNSNERNVTHENLKGESNVTVAGRKSRLQWAIKFSFILCKWFHALRKWEPDLILHKVSSSCSFLKKATIHPAKLREWCPSRHLRNRLLFISALISNGRGEYASGTFLRAPNKQGKKVQLIHPRIISRSYFKEEKKIKCCIPEKIALLWWLLWKFLAELDKRNMYRKVICGTIISYLRTLWF